MLVVVMLALPLVLSARWRLDDSWGERSDGVGSGVELRGSCEGEDEGMGSGMGSAGSTASVEVEEDLDCDSSAKLGFVAFSALSVPV